MSRLVLSLTQRSPCGRSPRPAEDPSYDWKGHTVNRRHHIPIELLMPHPMRIFIRPLLFQQVVELMLDQASLHPREGLEEGLSRIPDPLLGIGKPQVEVIDILVPRVGFDDLIPLRLIDNLHFIRGRHGLPPFVETYSAHPAPV